MPDDQRDLQLQRLQRQPLPEAAPEAQTERQRRARHRVVHLGARVLVDLEPPLGLELAYVRVVPRARERPALAAPRAGAALLVAHLHGRLEVARAVGHEEDVGARGDVPPQHRRVDLRAPHHERDGVGVPRDLVDDGVEVRHAVAQRAGGHELGVGGGAARARRLGEGRAQGRAEARLWGRVVGEELDPPRDGGGARVVAGRHEAEELVGDAAAAVGGRAALLGGDVALAQEHAVQGAARGLRRVGLDERDALLGLAREVGVLDGRRAPHVGQLADGPRGEARRGRELRVGDGVGERQHGGEDLGDARVLGEGHGVVYAAGAGAVGLGGLPPPHGLEPLDGVAVGLGQAEGAGEDAVEGEEGDVVVRGEGPAAREVALELPHADEGARGLVDLGRRHLRDEGRRHEVVDEVAVALEALVGREELDVLLGQDAVDEVAEEAGPVELLVAPEEDVLALERVGDDDPRQGAGLDEGLDYGGLVPCGEGREPALILGYGGSGQQ